MNKLILNGRAVAPAELKYSSDGKAYCRFTVACNSRKATLFMPCVIFGRYAEVMANYIDKGKPLVVEGALEESRYEANGEKRKKYSLVVESVELIGSTLGDCRESN